ncbi:hypothetical protein CR163_002890 [Prosthecochloris sp. ZM_2]|uniref:hypothetical protein n=1 Tax=Prosthecochloris sp. ZM_2 TaxID=2045206 RepID=UPI000DF7E4A1|nr:hypothetical protein [Prosthecochloris sp. ZM_2]RNA64283.1 hypothetical protein CR163_002890 [Prosthecochloris sp. ZM_2]
MAGRQFREWVPFALFLASGLFGYVLESVGYFTMLPGDLGDSRFNSVVLEHLFRWWTGSAGSLWSPGYFYPFQGGLAFSDNHFGTSIFYVPFRLMSFDRETAFAFWFVTGNVLNFIAAWYALRRIGFSGFSAAAGAFVFAFSLPVLAKEMHVQLVYRFAIPLAFSSFLRFIRTGDRMALWLVTLWLFVQFLCSVYLGFFLFYLLLAATAAVVAGRRLSLVPIVERSAYKNSGYSAREVAVAAVAVLSGISVAWMFFMYFSVSQEYGFSRPISTIKTMLPRLSSYLLADRAALSSWPGRIIEGIPMRHEYQMFFGYGVWVLLVVGAVATQIRGVMRSTGFIALVSLVLLVFGTLSVGGFSLYLLPANIPGLNAVRAVARIVLVMMMPVSILVAAGVDVLAMGGLPLRQRTASGTVTALLVFLGLSAETAAYKPYHAAFSAWKEREAAVLRCLPDDMDEDAILAVQMPEGEPFYLAEIDGMIVAQELGVATVNGYSGNEPPGHVRPLIREFAAGNLDSYGAFYGLPAERVAALKRRIVLVSPGRCRQEGRRGGPDGAEDALSAGQ